MFEDVIGQTEAIEELEHRVECYRGSKFFPHTLMIAEKGQGKTFLCQKLGEALGKPFEEISSAKVKKLDQLWAIIKKRPEATLFFDECHGLKGDVVDQLLTILSPNKDRKNTIDEFVVDFTKLTFLFATTEPHQMFVPLKDRLREVNLANYTSDELGEIVELHCEFIIADDVLPLISETIRQNARAAFLMADDINEYCDKNGLVVFEEEDWEKLKDILNIRTLGLTKIEVQALQFMRERGQSRLTTLASRLGLSNGAVQHGIEKYLLRTGLMTFSGSMRILTEEGKDLVDNAL